MPDNLAEAVHKVEQEKINKTFANQINSLKIMNSIIDLLLMGLYPGNQSERIAQSVRYLEALRDGMVEEIKKNGGVIPNGKAKKTAS